MYTMARQLCRAGRTGWRAAPVRRLLQGARYEPEPGPAEGAALALLPACLRRLRDEVRRTTRRSPPLLLMAFVRQESFFDPRAESPVGASA